MSVLSKKQGLMGRTHFPTSHLLDSFFHSDWPTPHLFNGNDGITADWVPTANIKEEESSFLVELSVPGFSRDELNIELDNNNLLRINGEREEESEEKSDNYTRKEFNYNSFTRSFQLPQAINENEITANCKNGMLHIKLPKSQAAILNKNIREISIS